jgi:hypothetical protein
LRIPTDLYLFSDSGGGGWRPLVPFSAGELDVTKHFLIHMYSSRWSLPVQNAMLLRLYAMCEKNRSGSGLSRSGTPLYHCIPTVARIVREDRVSYNVERMVTVIITDGESNGISTGSHMFAGQTLNDTRMHTWYRGGHNSVNLSQWFKDYTGSTLVTIRLFNNDFRDVAIMNSFLGPNNRPEPREVSRWSNAMKTEGFVRIDAKHGMDALFAVRGGLALSSSSRVTADQRPLDAAVAKRGARKFTEELTKFIS